MKISSTPLVIRKTQSYSQCHYIPIRIAKIYKTGHTKCWQGHTKARILIHCCQAYKIVQPLWKEGLAGCCFFVLFLKLNNHLGQCQPFHIWIFTQEKHMPMSIQSLTCAFSQQHYLQQPQNINKPNIHQQVNEETNWYILMLLGKTYHLFLCSHAHNSFDTFGYQMCEVFSHTKL